MIPPESWQAFAGIGGVVVFLGGIALALQRLGIIRRPAPPAPPATPEPGAAEDGLEDLRERVAVLEEKSRKHDERLAGVGKVHARIDDVATTTARIEGEITQMNSTLNLMLRHLLGETPPS